MRNGHWLLIDEVNAALPEILFVLQSLLDDDGYIVLAEKEDKEVVRPHPNFRIFATMNPFEDYVGTKELNKAFLSRFPITIKVDYPKPDQEFAIVKERYPALDDETIKSMIEVAKTTRESRANEEVDFVFSTRDLLQWAQVYQHTMSARRSALMTFIPKCNKNDAKALSSYIGLNFVEDETDVLNVRKGASIKIKEQIVMTKPPKVIVPGSILKILERVSIDPNDPHYQKAGDPGLLRKIKDSVRVEWVSVPKQSELVLLNEVFADDENYSRVVKEGEQWTVPAEDLDGKFMVVKKTR
jgi:MoxR-like ATPase